MAWVARLLARPPQKIRAWCTDGTFAVAAIPVYCDASGYWWIAWPEEGSFDIPIDDHVGEVLTLVANGAARRTAKRSGYSSLRAESRRKKLTRLIA